MDASIVSISEADELKKYNELEKSKVYNILYTNFRYFNTEITKFIRKTLS